MDATGKDQPPPLARMGWWLGRQQRLERVGAVPMNAWHEADIRYDDHTSTVDLRTLATWRLSILSDEAVAAGDEAMANACERAIAIGGGAAIEHDTGVVEILQLSAIPRSHLATCSTCGRSWDDSLPTAWTPTPSGRCPFEYDHEDEDP